MRIFKTTSRTGAIGGTVAVLLTVAAASAYAVADAPPTKSSRAHAVLVATQNELADTQHRVSDVRLEYVIDGREIYSLRGPNTACILVAGLDQPDGRSQSLSCGPTDGDAGQSPLIAGFIPVAGIGYVDLVWADGAMPSQVAVSGAPVDIRRGVRVVAAIRQDDAAPGALAWHAASVPVEVPLLSRSQRAAHAGFVK